MQPYLLGLHYFIINTLLRKSSIILILLIASCSPQKRLTRLQQCYPYLFDTTTTIDTLEIIIPKVDTFVSTWQVNDTIIYHDSLKQWTIKEYYFRDTVRIFYKSRPCTTIVQRQVEKIVNTPDQKKSYNWENILLIVLGIFALAFLIKLFK